MCTIVPFVIGTFIFFSLSQGLLNKVLERASMMSVKVLANEDTLLPTQMVPRLPARATFVTDTNFVSATNVFQFARARKRHEQQCFRNNVSSFATALRSTNHVSFKTVFSRAEPSNKWRFLVSLE